MYKTIIIKHIDKKLIDEWEALWNKAENANMFNSYEWFSTSLELSKNKEYEIYVCYKNDQLVAVLPLQTYKYFGINVLGTINKEHLIDTAFLMEGYSKDLFKHFFGIILHKKNVYFQKVDSKAVKHLHELFPNLFISLMSVNPVVDLTGDPYKFASPSIIAQVKKIIRKNPDQFEFIMHSKNLEKHFETIMKLQKESSKHARSIDIFTDKENRIYYQKLIKNCNKFVRINILYFNKKPIAYEYGYLYGDYYTGDQISFHIDYRKLSPGKTLMFHLFANLKKSNIRTLDMGGGISDYKMSYAQEYRLLYNICYSKNLLVMFWWKSINKARRMKQILFPERFTRDHEFLFKTI